MFPHKTGYDYIAVNFGGYVLCKTLMEAKQTAASMQPEQGQIYQRGFYSHNIGKMVGLDVWFPLDPLPYYLFRVSDRSGKVLEEKIEGFTDESEVWKNAEQFRKEVAERNGVIINYSGLPLLVAKLIQPPRE